MRRLLLIAAALWLLPAPAEAQFFGDIQCYTGSGRCVPSTVISGQFIKSADRCSPAASC